MRGLEVSQWRLRGGSAHSQYAAGMCDTVWGWGYREVQWGRVRLGMLERLDAWGGMVKETGGMIGLGG